MDKNIWYHGTPDVRELEREGGFTSRTMDMQYINNLDGYNELLGKVKSARESGDDNLYHKYLDLVSKFKSNYNMRKPIFVTNDYGVAKTYADPRRAFDYQNSKEKLLKVKTNDGKTVTIVATGDRFRFIEVSKVKRGFVNAGVNGDEFDKVLNSLNFYLKDKTRIKTDMIAAIGDWFNFDFIDVLGVLDSYEGGSVKSTVRMIFNPSDVKIINENVMSENKSIIKKLLKEDTNLTVTDESPDSISVLVQYNDRNAGIITVAPAHAEATLEIVSIRFKKDYETLFIITEAVNSLWGMFTEYNSIIVAPKASSIEFWNKMGFSRINKNYLIANRGH